MNRLRFVSWIGQVHLLCKGCLRGVGFRTVEKVSQPQSLMLTNGFAVTFLWLVHRTVGASVRIATQIVEIGCQHVWKELTNYMEGDLSPEMRDRIAHHLQGCRHCTAIYDGTRNVVQLLGDKKSIELPKGFSARLFDRLVLQSQQQS